MKANSLVVAGLLGLGAASAYAAILPYEECSGKYPADATWEPYFKKHWAAWKADFLSGGIVTAMDPDKNISNVSEAQSYALLLAVWNNDQPTFDAVLAATNDKFWNSGCGTGGWYGWKLPGAKSGCSGEGNYAGDADQDIAGALIFASVLKEKGKWSSSVDYKAKAKQVLTSVWNNLVDKSSGQINSWSGSGVRNPSYHMPGWYQVFKEFAAANSLTGQDWDKVRTASYALINAQPNASKGMARNFSSGSGGAPGEGTSTGPGKPDASQSRSNMGYDAIRVPYRMGIDAMWYKHTEAISWCTSVWKSGVVDPEKPGMYYVENPSLWGWGTEAQAYADAEYEKAMTAAMWGTAAVAVKDVDATSKSAAALLKGYLLPRTKTYDYFGLYDPASETNYYAQTVSFLGALAVAGRAWNVWDDLMTTNCKTGGAGSTKITTALTATPAAVEMVSGTVQSKNVSKVTATISEAVTWKLTFKGKTSTVGWDTTATSASIDVSWNSSKKGGVFGYTKTGEAIEVRLSFDGIDTTLTNWKTQITLGPSSSVLKGARPAAWSSQGVRLANSNLKAGERVSFRLKDLSGRDVLSNTSRVIEDRGGLILDLDNSASRNMMLLEVDGTDQHKSELYLVSPKF